MAMTRYSDPEQSTMWLTIESHSLLRSAQHGSRNSRRINEAETDTDIGVEAGMVTTYKLLTQYV